MVDVCGGECRYTVRLDALPYYPEFDAEVTAPLGSGEWHYFNLQLGGFDTLVVYIERLADKGVTPDYRLDAEPWPPPAPALPALGHPGGAGSAPDQAPSEAWTTRAPTRTQVDPVRQRV